MADPAGEADSGALRLDFDRRVTLRFHGSAITSDCGLLAYRELDDVLALTTSGGERLAEAGTGRNRRHLLVGLLRAFGERPAPDLHSGVQIAGDFSDELVATK